MPFKIGMGVPEMEAVWIDLSFRKRQGTLSKDEEKFFKKLLKHPGDQKVGAYERIKLAARPSPKPKSPDK